VASGERLVQRDAEAELVASRVDGPAQSCSGDMYAGVPIARRPRPARSPCSRDPGEPEVDDPARSSPPSPRQISTFSGLKSRCTTPASWAAARPRPACTNTSRICASDGRSREPDAQRHAVDEFHRDVDPRRVRRRARRPRGSPRRWGGEPGRRPGLAQQPARSSRRGACASAGAQELEGDLAVEERVVRGIDVAHAAAADPLDQREATDPGRRRVGRAEQAARHHRLQPLLAVVDLRARGLKLSFERGHRHLRGHATIAVLAVEPTEATDLDLLDAWRGGDARAGNLLFRRYFAPLARFFRNKVDVGVEDLIQGTFLACIEGRDRFREASSFRTYLFAIARNLLYGYYRRQHRAVDFVQTSVIDLGASPSGPLGRREEAAALLRALRSIPLEFQVVLELSYWEDMKAPRDRGGPRDPGQHRAQPALASPRRAASGARGRGPRARRCCARRWPTSTAGPRPCGPSCRAPRPDPRPDPRPPTISPDHFEPGGYYPRGPERRRHRRPRVRACFRRRPKRSCHPPYPLTPRPTRGSA
jgi:RNA polymerase sigma factor (sigma-70 family)